MFKKLLILSVALFLSFNAACSKKSTATTASPASFSAYLDKYEKAIAAMEKMNFSKINAADMGKMSANQMEMAGELEKLQKQGLEMTPDDMSRYGELTQRLVDVMGKAQTSMK